MKTKITLIIIGLIAVVSLWSNFKTISKDHQLAQLILNPSADQHEFVTKLDELLGRYPEENNGGYIRIFYVSVQNELLAGTPGIENAVPVLEKYTNKNDPRNLIQLGRTYAILWFTKHDKTAYDKAIKYWLIAKEQRPLDQLMLRGLYCTYMSNGETKKADPIKKIIDETKDNDLNLEDCSI